MELAQKSNNAKAIKNKEEFLQLIEHAYATLRATTTVEAASSVKPAFAAKKKARTSASASASAAMPVNKGEEEELQVDVVRKQCDGLQQLMPLLRAKHEAELQHMQRLNAEALQQSQQVDSQALLHQEAMLQQSQQVDSHVLNHKAALLERERIEREERLVYEDGLIQREARRLQLEHDKRMITDAAYKQDHLKQTEAAAEAAEVKSKAEDAVAELKAKTDAKAASYRRAADTRRERAAEANLKKRLEAYVDAGTATARLVLEPALNKALRDTMPDDAQRLAFIRSLDGAVGAQTKGAGVYVIGFEGLTYSRYVGYSKDIDARIERHRSGDGAACVKGAQNITRLPLYTTGNIENLDGWERSETIAQMHKHGVENVRGWHYVAPSAALSSTLRKEAVKNICSHYSLCVRCGRAGHYIADCKGEISEWMAV